MLQNLFRQHSALTTWFLLVQNWNFQLTLGQPLLHSFESEHSLIQPRPFHQSNVDVSSQPSEHTPRVSSHGLNDEDSSRRMSPLEIKNTQNLIRRSVQSESDPTPSQIGSLCSIFRTFLDAMNVECRASSPSTLRRHFDSASGEIDSETSQNQGENDGHKINQRTSQRRSDSLNESEELEDDGLHVVYTHLPRPITEDETKILKDKTTIIVPERGCPHGQRRDPYRGYCRPVLRIRPYYGQQKSKYFYSRYVAVPTLHFILPHY